MTDTCNKGPEALSAGKFAAAQSGEKSQSVQADKPTTTKAPWTAPAGDDAPVPTLKGFKGPPIC